MFMNADGVLNSFKARAWVGHQLMSDDLWESNGFNEPDSIGTTQALLVINTALQVINYLNDEGVNEIWASVIGGVTT
jgi:hypothetical protein